MFNLSSYIREITQAMTANAWSAEVAVDHFVTNLNTFSNHHPFQSNLNFRELGQHWGKLSYKEKNAQKAAAVQQALKSARNARRVES